MVGRGTPCAPDLGGTVCCGGAHGVARPTLSVAVSSCVRRVLGLTGSTSRIKRRISSRPAATNSFVSNGVLPVSNSYSSTPRL